MRVRATAVSKGPKGRALPPTDIVWRSGTAVFVEVETAQRPTVLGLIVSGRMKPDAGEVTLDGAQLLAARTAAAALTGQPDLSRRDWADAGSAHAAAFREAVRVKRSGRTGGAAAPRT